MKYITTKQFKNQLADTPGSLLPLVQKFVSGAAVPEQDRCITFTISSEDVDRVGDKIFQSGWQLDNYRANPVVLWAHDDCQYPIGKCVSIGVEGTSLKATVEFVPADVPLAGAAAEAVYQLCKQGFLSTTSVGFRPLEIDFADDASRVSATKHGCDIFAAELLEFSIVSIPCNPAALIDAPSVVPGIQEQVSASYGAHSHIFTAQGEHNHSVFYPEAKSVAQEAIREELIDRDAEKGVADINTKVTQLIYRQRVLDLLDL